MNKGLWIARKNYLCILMKTVSDKNGGDEIEFLRQCCREVLEAYPEEKIEEAIRCYEEVLERLKYEVTKPQNPGLSGKADLGSDSSFDLVAPFMHHSPLAETTTKKGAKDGSAKNSTGQEDQKGSRCDPDRSNGTTGICEVATTTSCS